MNDHANKNLLSVDVLRFIAAFCVYYYHQHTGSLIAKASHLDLFNLTDKLGALYAVPLFFLLSGFCIHLSSIRKATNKEPLPLKSYYLNRFWRIYPAYLFALLFSGCVALITEPQQAVSLSDFFNHIFVLQGFSIKSFNSINVVLWTISIEMAFYAIYPVFYLIQIRQSSFHALCFSGVVTALSITYFQFKSEITLPERYLFTNIWFGWCFGAWLCDKYYHKPDFFNSLGWKIIVLIIIALVIGVQFVNWQNDILIKYLIYIIGWSPILIWAIKNETKFKTNRSLLKVPLALGISSYSLYLLHEPLIKLKNHAIHLWIPAGLHMPAMLICLFAIPLICYLNYKIIEIPFINSRKRLTSPK